MNPQSLNSLGDGLTAITPGCDLGHSWQRSGECRVATGADCARRRALALMAAPSSAGSVMSNCWRMTNDSYYAAGLGPGIEWKNLGSCRVNLASEGEVTQIEVIKPKQVLKMKQGQESNVAVTKPYQNPTGMWMLGIWETDAKQSAIFGTKAWGN